MQRFSALVRTLLASRSLSGNQLADLVNYDRGAMARIIAGRRPCTPQVATLIDETLDAPGAVAAAAAAAPQAADRALRTLGTALRREFRPGTRAGDWEQTVSGLASRSRGIAPALLLGQLSGPLQDLAAGISRERAPSAKRDLARSAAILGGLTCRAFTLTRDQSRWTRSAVTARRAALESGDSAVLAWVLALESTGHYHDGNLRAAAQAAAAARMVGISPSGTVFPAAQQMLLHDATAARAALTTTERLHSRLMAQSPGPAGWGYNENHLALQRIDALFLLGDPAARRELEDARRLGISRDGHYALWASLRLAEAACMIRDGDAETALGHLTAAAIALTPHERAGLITLYCHDVLALLPCAIRESGAARAPRARLDSPARGANMRPAQWSRAGPAWDQLPG